MPITITELNDALASAVERAAGYTARVNARARYGSSGVVWDAGVVVTADHTVERDEDVTVSLPDGSEVAATIAGRDPGSDLAVLRVADGIAAAPRAGEVRVGHLVLAVGRGFGGGVGASLGIVSSPAGRQRSRRGDGLEGLIRPDLTLYPGFSGGPLVDVTGALVGINTSGLREPALTIPVATAQPIVDQLLEHGRLKRGYLGLTSQPVRLPETIAAEAGQETGLLIVGVETGSPAEAGGAILGDVLVGIDDTPVRDTDDLRAMLAAAQPGQALQLRLLRGGVARDLSATIGER